MRCCLRTAGSQSTGTGMSHGLRRTRSATIPQSSGCVERTHGRPFPKARRCRSAAHGRRNMPSAPTTASPSRTRVSATLSARTGSSATRRWRPTRGTRSGPGPVLRPGGRDPGGPTQRTRLWVPEDPAVPRDGSGSGRPAASHAQERGPSGQRSQAGSRAVHTVAPRSSTAEFQAQERCGGTDASARDWASPSLRRCPATARASTRAALVSITPTGRSNANASTARAVYDPTPGRSSNVPSWSGIRPPWRSTMAWAQARRRTARRL